MTMENTYEQEFADAIGECLRKLADVSRRMGDSYRTMEKSVSEMEHQLDRSQEKADISQRREIALVDENQRLREECARLRGEMQIVSDTAHRASIGSQIDRRLGSGHPAFSDERWSSNAPVGAPYKGVTADIQDTIARLEAMEPKSAMDQPFMDKLNKTLSGAL